MTPDNYVTDISRDSEGNPWPGVAVLNSRQCRGAQRLHTHPPCRIPEQRRRRQDKQGRSSDRQRQVKVTIGGCGG